MPLLPTGGNTRSVFEWSKAALNSEFFSSLTGYLRPKNSVCPTMYS